MSNFVPRLDKNGMWQNPYWYASSPFYPSYQLPNCTCYAWGRFWEITGERPQLPTGDAGTWFPRAVASGIYKTGTTPEVGAVVCWERPGYAGHVGIVERVESNGDFLISNSNYQRPLASYPPDMKDYFFTSHCSAATMRPDWLGPSFKFQGFIYAPNIVPPDPPVPGDVPMWLIIRAANKRRKKRGVYIE